MTRTRLWLSKAWMTRKFHVEKKTEKEVAEEAGTSQVTINKWRRHFKL